MAPLQVISVPQTGPYSMPLAIATNSAGKGTKLCRTMSRIEAATPHMPQAWICSSTASIESAKPGSGIGAPSA